MFVGELKCQPPGYELSCGMCAGRAGNDVDRESLTLIPTMSHAVKSEPTYYVRLGIAVCVVGACVGDVAYGVRYYEKSVHSHGRSDE